MPSISAVSIAPDAREWLATSQQARLLHVFDQACNLINERRAVLSVVTQRIGNGPFNLVVEDEICFSDYLNAQSPVSFRAGQMDLGDLTIDTAGAQVWSPRPDWEKLHAARGVLLDQLKWLPISKYQPELPNALISDFAIALAAADIESAVKFTPQLAGLGNGLTPAGDDFIVGALLAVWLIHPPETARALAREIASLAAPLTTSLSAAWLMSTGKGEAGAAWRRFLAALLSTDRLEIQESKINILSTGASSGADALAGFTGTALSRVELTRFKLP
jgi:hypothetical protein